MNWFYKILKQGSKLILGLVFFIAGILKLMDPTGTGLIVSEYFSFFHLSFMKVISLPFGLMLAFLETTIGVALLTGVFRKVAATACAIFIGGFTMITFILWIFNPNMDCGCFGEAVHLTHFQSFMKNVILLLLALAAFRPYRMFEPIDKTRKSKYAVFVVAMLSVIVFSVYSLMYIPLVDYTPFNTTSMLASSVAQDEKSGEEEYVSTFIYEKNGQTGVFTLDKLPDSTWTFIETRTVRKMDKIEETDYPVLSFRNQEGEYCDSLAANGNVLVSSVFNMKKLSDKKLASVCNMLSAADSVGMTAMLLLSSDPEYFRQVLEKSSLSQQDRSFLMGHTYYSDFKTLISLNRSNGGAVFFNEGNLIEKWAFRSLPSEAKVARLQKKDVTELMLSSNTKGHLWFQAFLLYTLVIMVAF